MDRVEDVLVYDGAVVGEFFVGEVAFMDDLYLCDDRHFL